MPGTVTVVNKYKHVPNASTIYIGRGSIFGNPWPVSMGRTECIEKYRIETFEHNMNKPLSAYRKAVMALVERVRKGESIYLQCFCAPQACHGDIIKAYIDKVVLRSQSKPPLPFTTLR